MRRPKIMTRGEVVIPAYLRRKYGLEPGIEVNVIDYGGVIAIVPLLTDPLTQANGTLQGSSALTEALLVERTQETKS